MKSILRLPVNFLWLSAVLVEMNAAAAIERVLLPTEVPPVVRAGRTLAPLRAVSEAFQARVQWKPPTRQILIARGDRQVLLTIGKREAIVNGKAVALEVAPAIEGGRTLVPLRFLAAQLGFPARYDPETHSVLLDTAPGSGTVRVLPLETICGGIVLLEPHPGVTVTSPVRVHGQANVFEGTVVIEVQGPEGRVLGSSAATGAMGSFHPFTTEIPFTVPAGITQGRLFAYSPGGRSAADRLFPVTLPIRFRAAP